MAFVADGDIGDRIALAVERIRQSVLTIDELWRAAIDTGTGALAIELGEASHALHLALIALIPHGNRIGNPEVTRFA